MAARLVQSNLDGDVVGFYDALGEVARNGLSGAVAVVAVLARHHSAALLLRYGLDDARGASSSAPTRKEQQP
jgi:hypothetical protein